MASSAVVRDGEQRWWVGPVSAAAAGLASRPVAIDRESRAALNSVAFSALAVEMTAAIATSVNPS
jgi:hypothetical protein